MSPDEQILQLLKAWAPEVNALLHQAGYFELDREEIEPEEAWKELGPAFPRKVAAASIQKNTSVWDLVKSAISAVAFAAGVSTVAKQLNVPASAYDWNPRAQRFYDTHGDFFIKTMSRTDIESLHQRIQQDFNLNPKDFGQKFADSYSCSPARLERIKRTETHASTQGGGWNFAQEAGAQFKQWMCTPRNRWPRPTHRAVWYEVRALDQPFSNGLYYPSEVGCRCYLLYFLDVNHLERCAKNAGL